MHPRINLVTLGVTSVERSRAFYERLGWTASGASQEGIAFFQLGPTVLALFGRTQLAEDAHVADGPPGFSGVSLAQNFESAEAVNAAFEAALAAGATALKQPQQVFWGGYSGYFADPDGFCWEVAHNAFFALNEDGALVLPE